MTNRNNPISPLHMAGAFKPSADAVEFLLQFFGYPTKVPKIDETRGTVYWKLSGKAPNKKENSDDDDADAEGAA